MLKIQLNQAITCNYEKQHKVKTIAKSKKPAVKYFLAFERIDCSSAKKMVMIPTRKR